MGIAEQKHAWDFAITILEKLLVHEKNKGGILQLKLHLFSANLNIGKLPEAIQLGEKILSDPEEMSLLGDNNKEILLGQTISARLKRGEHEEAKVLLEKYPIVSKGFEFSVAVEAEVYLRNKDAHNALSAVVAGVKTLKTPTPEQYGVLFFIFGQIGNLIDLSITSQERIEVNSFVKFHDRDRWYFVGDENELDATKVPAGDEKYSIFLGKKVGQRKSLLMTSIVQAELNTLYKVFCRLKSTLLGRVLIMLTS